MVLHYSQSLESKFCKYYCLIEKYVSLTGFIHGVPYAFPLFAFGISVLIVISTVSTHKKEQALYEIPSFLHSMFNAYIEKGVSFRFHKHFKSPVTLIVSKPRRLTIWLLTRYGLKSTVHTV